MTRIPEPPHLASDLRALQLSTIAAQWQPLAEAATRQRQPHAAYLAERVHLEVIRRRERRIQRRIAEAHFPRLKTLEAFDFTVQPAVDREAVLELAQGHFVAEAANVVLIGGVGTGKTHLAIALGLACCQHDQRVRFTTAAELTNTLIEAQGERRLARKSSHWPALIS
jgi:DNA replication protein DnaC